MHVAAEPVPGWDNKPIPHSKPKYPQTHDPHAPRNFFVGLFIGPRGGGKTFSICKLLKTLEQRGIYDEDGKRVSQRVVLISPTADSNPVFNALKHLDDADVLPCYSDEALDDLVEDIKREREATQAYKDDMVLWRKFLKARTPDGFTDYELATLDRWGFQAPPEPRYPNGCVCHVIIDDCVGSAAFKSTGKSSLTNLLLRNRHMGCNILIASQNLKSVPKSMRANASLWVVYRFGNKDVLDDLADEVSGLTPEQFHALYGFATQEDHNALVIDYSQPKDQRFKRNFDTVLRLP